MTTYRLVVNDVALSLALGARQMSQTAVQQSLAHTRNHLGCTHRERHVRNNRRTCNSGESPQNMRLTY